MRLALSAVLEGRVVKVSVGAGEWEGMPPTLDFEGVRAGDGIGRVHRNGGFGSCTTSAAGRNRASRLYRRREVRDQNHSGWQGLWEAAPRATTSLTAQPGVAGHRKEPLMVDR
jgi:hypothetical protein